MCARLCADLRVCASLSAHTRACALVCCFPVQESVLRVRGFLSAPHCLLQACVRAKSLSRVQLSVAPWTVAHQAPLSMGFSRQEHWRGLPRPPPGHLPDPGTNLASLMSQRWQAGSLPLRPRGSPLPPENLLITTGQGQSACLVVSALAAREKPWGRLQQAGLRLTASVCPPPLSPPQLCPQGLHILQHHRLPRSGREGRPQASIQEESHRLVPVAPGARPGREPEAECGQREHRGPAGEGSAGPGGGAASRSRQAHPSARPGSAGPNRSACPASTRGLPTLRACLSPTELMIACSPRTILTSRCRGLTEVRVLIKFIHPANV